MLPLSLTLIFFSLALARPQVKNRTDSQIASGIDIMLTIDVSWSMLINDFVVKGKRSTRIEAAKQVAKNFIAGRPNDRMGIVAFAGRPFEASPITLQHTWLEDSLDYEVNPNQQLEQGTAIGSALSAAGRRLMSRKIKSKSKIIVLITDGSNNSGEIPPLEAAKLLADLGIKVYTVAIGTTHGRLSGRFQNFPAQEFDTGTLEEIAKITDGQYFRALDTDSLVESFHTINDLEKTDSKKKTRVRVKEYHHWFTGMALIFLVVSLLIQTFAPPPGPN